MPCCLTNRKCTYTHIQSIVAGRVICLILCNFTHFNWSYIQYMYTTIQLCHKLMRKCGRYYALLFICIHTHICTYVQMKLAPITFKCRIYASNLITQRTEFTFFSFLLFLWKKFFFFIRIQSHANFAAQKNCMKYKS